MPITAENLQRFLAKRNLDTEVTLSEDTYLVQVSSTTVEDIAHLLATIKEPGRFIVSLKLQDITELLVTSSKLPTQIEELGASLKVLEGLMTRNMTNLENTDDKLRKQNLESVAGLHTYIDEVTNSIKKDLANSIIILNKRLAELESKPWWKKW